MSNQIEVPYKGIRLTVEKEKSGLYTVFFTNMPGHFEPLHNVKALREQPSFDEAVLTAKKFVDDHQWVPVGSVSVFNIFVRLWWDGDWGYRVEGYKNDAGFKSFEEAKAAGIEAATEKIAEIDAEIEKSKSG